MFYYWIGFQCAPYFLCISCHYFADMALSAAERQRRFRANRDADPERRQRYLQKQKKRYQEDKLEKRVKPVKEMTPREHRAIKKKWRKNQAIKRQRDKLLRQNTPPSTTESSPSEQWNSPPQPGPSQQRMKTGALARRVRALRRKRENEKRDLEARVQTLNQQLQMEKKKVDMYRKRLARKRKTEQEDTPRTKTKRLLRNVHKKEGKQAVRRVLDFHHSVVGQIKRNYKIGQFSIKNVVAGTILQKYKFRTQARKQIGAHFRIVHRTKSGCLSSRVKQDVRAFYERDDVSRILPGKKDTITKNKQKKQKRLLSDTLHNLHLKFNAEAACSISFSTFYRLKPFWVTYARPSDRETCLCKMCENTSFYAEALCRHKLVDSPYLGALVRQVVCSTADKKCMYGECKICEQKTLSVPPKTDLSVAASWIQWQTVHEDRTFKAIDKRVTFIVKTEENGTL